MEDASPVSKEDASLGSLPAEKKGGARPSEKKSSTASGELPDAAIDDLPNETFSSSKAEAGTSFSHAFSSACCSACHLGVAHLRIACGVCLLAVAGVLLCIAAAAALSVYEGYDFTEGVVGQFMSSRIAPIVTHFTHHPWLRGVPSSATIAAAIAAVLVTAGVFAASLPLLQCRAPAPLRSHGGWAQSSRRAVSACLRRCRLTLRSPLLLLSPGGGRCRRNGSGSLLGGSDRGERRRGAAAVAPAGCCSSGGGAGAGWEAAASSSAAAAAGPRDGGGASQRVDADSGWRPMHGGAAAAAQNEKIDGGYPLGRAAEIRHRKAGAVCGAQQSVRHSLQILPWWSAPLLRLKQVIRSFLHIVAARLRGPEATEVSVVPPPTGGTAAARAAAVGGGPGRAAAGGLGAFISGLAAGAGAAAKPATATPRAAAGAPPAATGAAAADLRVAGRETSAEAGSGTAAEARRGAHGGEGGGRDAEKNNERESRPMTTFGGAEGRSTDTSPRRRRSRDAVSAAQSGKAWDSTAAAVAAMHTVQQVKQQERNVSAKERGRTVEGSSLSEEERKARAYPPVEDGHRSNKPNGDAAVAGRRGDSESSSGGSLQGESEVEDWLVLQEADGRRK